MDKYKIIRHFQRSNRKITIARNLSLEEAQRHCSDPDTSSTKCNTTVGMRRTRLYGPWFDGYSKQK